MDSFISVELPKSLSFMDKEKDLWNVQTVVSNYSSPRGKSLILHICAKSIVSSILWVGNQLFPSIPTLAPSVTIVTIVIWLDVLSLPLIIKN